MEKRWAMTNRKDGIHIEVAFSVIGHQFLEMVRKSYPEFKGCQIIEILQANPSEIEIGVFYHSEYGKWVKGMFPEKIYKPFPFTPSHLAAFQNNQNKCGE